MFSGDIGFIAHIKSMCEQMLPRDTIRAALLFLLQVLPTRLQLASSMMTKSFSVRVDRVALDKQLSVRSNVNLVRHDE